MGDDTVRIFGIVIAICGALAVFGGETFAIWSFGLETESDFGDTEIDYKFGTTELHASAEFKYDGESESESDSIAYDDDFECDCDELKGFFSNLKMMFYGLILFGIAIAYFGNSGDTENLPAVAGITALLSLGILAYTFMTLPGAFEEDIGFFEEIGEDEAFFINDEKEHEGIDLKVSAMPHVGFFLPVVSLTLAGLLVKPELMD
tara:strand:- start:45 stop:659 length:615 start_codon:yes stop_codon:yes gene_type:complete